jgi:hypothetical protein
MDIMDKIEMTIGNKTIRYDKVDSNKYECWETITGENGEWDFCGGFEAHEVILYIASLMGKR